MYTPVMETTQPPIQRDTEFLSSGVKRPESDNHSFPPEIVVRTEWSHTSTPTYALMAYTGALPKLNVLSEK
jgi:hypothetical protein